MIKIYDFRYPFSSMYEFFSGLYFLRLEALHLTVGYIFFIYYIFRLLYSSKFNFTLKLSIIYFSGTVFNNYAFNFIGISIAEFFGILACIFFLKNKRFYLNPISNYMFLFAFIALIHLLILSIFNDNILNTLGIRRIAVILKICVLAVNIMILFFYLKQASDIEKAIKSILFLFNVVALCYFIQIIVFIFGTVPYGSFSPAGWSESIIPSFGSVSIERGHLGKFFVPLFPLYLFSYIRYNTKKSFLSFFLLAFLNISASAYAFISIYLLLTVLFLRKWVINIIIPGVLFMVVFILFFNENMFILFQKVYDAVITQNTSGAIGGRSFSMLLPILENHNFFGYGYGGSSYRNLHGIDGFDLNNSIVSFFSQLSFVGIIIIMTFLYMLYKIRLILLTLGNEFYFEKKLLIISLVMLIFIFSADILYFVPTIWLPVVLLLIIINPQAIRGK